MTIPTTYTELKTEIANWLKRDDMTNDIETMIKIGEAKINRVSRLSAQETEAAVVMTSNQSYTNLPTGFLEHISLIYDNDLYEPPEKVNIEKIDVVRAQTGTGIPCAFAISNTKYFWDIKAQSALALTSRHYKKWDIGADATNWLLTNNPDAYIYAALAASGLFLKHPMLSEWRAEAKAVIDELEYQSSKLKKSNLRVDSALLGVSHSNILTDN